MNAEDFYAVKAAHARRREARRDQAEKDYPAAARGAAASGLRLIRCGVSHYRLALPGRGGWALNLYPGNGRIYPDPATRCPFLHVGPDWGLCDAVRAAAMVICDGGMK